MVQLASQGSMLPSMRRRLPLRERRTPYMLEILFTLFGLLHLTHQSTATFFSGSSLPTELVEGVTLVF